MLEIPKFSSKLSMSRMAQLKYGLIKPNSAQLYQAIVSYLWMSQWRLFDWTVEKKSLTKILILYSAFVLDNILGLQLPNMI